MMLKNVVKTVKRYEKRIKGEKDKEKYEKVNWQKRSITPKSLERDNHRHSVFLTPSQL